MAGSINKYGVSSLNKDGVVRADWPGDPNVFRAAISKAEAMNLAYWLVQAALGRKHELLAAIAPWVPDDDSEVPWGTAGETP